MRLGIKKGDTLIEVLFAFAILATIVGFAFTSVMQSYKSAVQAQNQTQAYLLAQYQADGLKTYRDSLEWEGSGPVPLPSFLNGSATLPQMEEYYLDQNKEFCMETQPGAFVTEPLRWVVTTTDDCANNIASIAPSLKNASVSIKLSNPEPADNPVKVTAIITVSYDIPNATVSGVVVNRIFLTKGL